MPNTRPKPFVFVLMPFNDIYELGIKAACNNVDTYCERVDEQIFTDSILQRIYNQIAKADIIVADMSEVNANVFYEVGYAHALGKRVILLTKDSDDIPFDLTHYPHIIYEDSIVNLKSELERRIQWYISNPEEDMIPSAKNISLYINGQLLEQDIENNINIPINNVWHRETHTKNGLDIKIDFKNNSDVFIHRKHEIGLISKPPFDRNLNDYNIIKVSDEELLHITSDELNLFPNGWGSVTFPIYCRQNDFFGENLEWVLRVYTELGPSEYLLNLHITNREEAFNENNWW